MLTAAALSILGIIAKFALAYYQNKKTPDAAAVANQELRHEADEAAKPSTDVVNDIKRL